MEPVIEALRALVAPLPPPLRVASLVFVVVALVCQLGPLAIAATSRLVVAGTPAAVAALVLPEYVLTGWLRDLRLNPLPGTYLFGSVLEVAAQAVIATAASAGRHLGTRRKIPWLGTGLVAAVPIVLFYGAAALPNSTQVRPVVTVVDSTQWTWLSVDGWLMTGDLRPCSQPGAALAGSIAKPLAACAPGPRPSATAAPPRSR